MYKTLQSGKATQNIKIVRTGVQMAQHPYPIKDALNICVHHVFTALIGNIVMVSLIG